VPLLGEGQDALHLFFDELVDMLPAAVAYVVDERHEAAANGHP
jgi:hypothetical protein